MSDFKRSLRTISAEAVPYIAGQLLRQLGEDGSSDFKAGSEMREPSLPEAAKRTEFEFPEMESGGSEREFLQAEKSADRSFSFPDGAAGVEFDRDFGSEAGLKRKDFDFPEGIVFSERMAPDAEREEVRESYAAKGRRRGVQRSDTYRQMEEISEFFRRDGRRYDNGFKQY